MITDINTVFANKMDGKELTVRGWIYRHRVGSAGSMVFAVLRDSTGVLQATIKKDKVDEKSWTDASEAYVESSVVVSGTVKKDDRAPGGFELVVDKFETVCKGEPFPIAKDLSEEYLLDVRHLWIRSQKLTKILQIRSTVIQSIHDFFRGRGYTLFDPPILSPNACEGKMTLFEVQYFQDKMYLTQSWQLYAEAAIFALGKIYDVAPTFRAERSKTSRHLAEFWMAEMEAPWMELAEVTEVAKDEIKFIVEKVLEKHEEDLKFLGRDVSKLKTVVSKPFPTITYSEVLKILKEKEGMDIKWGEDLRTIEEEKVMTHFDTPVVVTNYPVEIMAFYKPEDKKNPKTALCFDMLAPEGYGEIVGGSQRSLDVEDMKKRLAKEEGNPDDYSWYFDLRKYGSVPHSGYGVGVERVVRWLCGSENIKDAIAFPRTMNRNKP
ncbi:Asparagine--tRNA ligase [Candidatus Bilamarchaeum dharawalense]|uniref:Asparagine--tRNA ligase n=1 Tax=Candidatus Bilamarchaeum dharawalense TaxID=2885759 RepID=A0A5E4LU40_9ARCH|nr:Asparagine--tRNA ligase [Candidatus Bilamarchaeum dharawalense]